MIQGWDKGIVGTGDIPPMKVGGTRMLYIPAALGYGARGAGGVIPPNADLVFEGEHAHTRARARARERRRGRALTRSHAHSLAHSLTRSPARVKSR